MDDATSTMSAAEVEQMLGVSRTTVWRLAKSGDLRAQRMTPAMVFDRKVVEAFAEARKAATA
jgi:excisionase family DNA binding protein